MAKYPAAIEQLVQAFTGLPGVGRKTAERYAVWLMKQPAEVAGQMSAALLSAQRTVNLCKQCFNFATKELCDICGNPQRDAQTVCVVTDGTAVAALEQTGVYHGTYHVLGGAINQLEGIGPEQLHIAELVERVKRDQVTEIILGTNPDMTGEATALYVIEALKEFPVTTTRLARGLSAGSDIEYADDVTLTSALQDRKTI